MARLELLAPAKDVVCGQAAIDCGADAVYIGARRFGAREQAGNSVEDIQALCEYAHRYWARVYVAVNTLLRDEELEEAVGLIWDVYRAGADAVIIQDVGLLECDLPPIALIASTQMHNYTPERVKFLEEVGFTRAILARELSLDEVRAIRAAAPEIELECFIHGALCVSYSGQCYLSYARGGRSGNRGACAQPCRLRYTLQDRDGTVLAGPAHLLSLKDLNLTERVAELVSAGVSSFKIEGRLKEREYVMNTVAWYRARLDEVVATRGYARASSGRSQAGFEPDVRKTFNRGYTSYFISGRSERMSEPASPKWIGEPLGIVRKTEGKVVEIATDAELTNGDGISFFNRQNELCGTRVNEAHGQRAVVNDAAGLVPGVMVYRNYDRVFMSMLERARPVRTIGVRFEIAVEGDEAQCQVCDEDGTRACVRFPWAGVPARNEAEIRGRVQRAFGKLGGTEFRCEGVEVAAGELVLPSVAWLNAARRKICELLRATRLAVRPKLAVRARGMEAKYPAEAVDLRGNVLNEKAAAFYRRHGVREIAMGGDARTTLEGEVVMTTRFCVLYECGLCLQTARGRAVRRPLYLVDEQGRRLEVVCDPASCCLRYILRAAK